MGNVNPIGKATGTKAKDEEWFPKDLEPTKDAKIRASIAVDPGVVIEVTFDGGTVWVVLNSSVALGDRELFNLDEPIRLKEKFNLRTPTVGGTTILRCLADQVSGEG